MNWINVKDRLPNQFEIVLITDGMDVDSGAFQGDKHWIIDNDFIDSEENITHWMRLPEPPEDE